MFNDDLRQRTFNFALNCILFLRELPDNQESKIFKNQLIRSSSSTAANFRAWCTARSERERYAKVCIVVEEVNESAFWLELLEKLYMAQTSKIQALYQEAEELTKIFGKLRGKLNNN